MIFPDMKYPGRKRLDSNSFHFAEIEGAIRALVGPSGLIRFDEPCDIPVIHYAAAHKMVESVCHKAAAFLAFADEGGVSAIFG